MTLEPARVEAPQGSLGRNPGLGQKLSFGVALLKKIEKDFHGISVGWLPAPSNSLKGPATIRIYEFFSCF
jgi:hypothetical protein